MTAQVMDCCEWDGLAWSVCEWDGPAESLPRPETFGLAARMEHTANYRGFVRHVAVRDGRLWLVRLRVALAAGFEAVAPPSGATRTVDGDAVWFAFADWPVPFTGRLRLGREFDERAYRHAGMQPLAGFREQATLVFADGVLRAAHRHGAPPSEPDTADETV